MNKAGAAINLQYKLRVIVPAEKVDTVTIIQSDHNRKQATLIACIRASLTNEKTNNQAVPTFIIYKKKEILKDCRQLVD